MDERLCLTGLTLFNINFFGRKSNDYFGIIDCLKYLLIIMVSRAFLYYFFTNFCVKIFPSGSTTCIKYTP